MKIKILTFLTVLILSSCNQIEDKKAIVVQNQSVKKDSSLLAKPVCCQSNIPSRFGTPKK